MASKESASTRVAKAKVKRFGVHSKKNNSKLKTSKRYRKRYAGQGR
jgi:hypothetical protein